MNDVMRMLAAWALIHETADEGWKAAVGRGHELAPGELDQGPEAFVDGLAALVAEEKERLKASLANANHDSGVPQEELVQQLEAMRFELAELRGCIESLQASVDAIAARSRNE